MAELRIVKCNLLPFVNNVKITQQSINIVKVELVCVIGPWFINVSTKIEKQHFDSKRIVRKYKFNAKTSIAHCPKQAHNQEFFGAG